MFLRPHTSASPFPLLRGIRNFPYIFFPIFC